MSDVKEICEKVSQKIEKSNYGYIGLLIQILTAKQQTSKALWMKAIIAKQMKSRVMAYNLRLAFFPREKTSRTLREAQHKVSPGLPLPPMHRYAQHTERGLNQKIIFNCTPENSLKIISSGD